MPHLPKKKRCSHCGKYKAKSAFNKDRQSADKLQSYCKLCKRNTTLFAKYKITPEKYKLLFKQQNASCAICGRTVPSKVGWVVDHDHKTGKVRGILCDYCNVGIGRLGDDPIVVKSALIYLNRNGLSSSN